MTKRRVPQNVRSVICFLHYARVLHGGVWHSRGAEGGALGAAREGPYCCGVSVTGNCSLTLTRYLRHMKLALVFFCIAAVVLVVSAGMH